MRLFLSMRLSQRCTQKRAYGMLVDYCKFMCEIIRIDLSCA